MVEIIKILDFILEILIVNELGSLNNIYFFLYFCSEQQNIILPEFGRYATGILFLDKNTHTEVETAFEKLAEECNLRVCHVLLINLFQYSSYRVVCTLCPWHYSRDCVICNRCCAGAMFPPIASRLVKWRRSVNRTCVKCSLLAIKIRKRLNGR